MPEPTTPNAVRLFQGGHADRAAARVARQLIAKHGYVRALCRASDRYDRYRAENAGGPIVVNPGRWLYWRKVVRVIRRAMPPALDAEMESGLTLLRALRLGYGTAE